MDDNFKTSVAEKLIEDGSNWITYRDRMFWAMDSYGLSDHLTSTTVTKTYTGIGNIGNLTPEMRWRTDEAIVQEECQRCLGCAESAFREAHNT